MHDNHSPHQAPHPRRVVTRRTFLNLTAYSAGIGLLAACAQTVPVPAADTGAASTAAEPAQDASWENGMLRAGGNPKSGGTLRVALGVNTQHFDIHQGAAAAPLTQIYNNLVRNNPLDGLYTVVGDLAPSWEISEDGLVYTFHLREGVTFHDGTPFTGEDVLATFNRIIDPPEGMVSVSRDQFSAVTNIELVDDFTIRFHISSPQAYFLSMLTMTTMTIYSKTIMDPGIWTVKMAKIRSRTNHYIVN